MTDEETIREQVEKYRAASDMLLALRAAVFPRNTPVMVNADHYKGPGVAHNSASRDVPPHLLAVLLENGNIWHYPIEQCHPTKWKDMPASNRRQYLNWRGIRVSYVRDIAAKLP